MTRMKTRVNFQQESVGFNTNQGTRVYVGWDNMDDTPLKDLLSWTEGNDEISLVKIKQEDQNNYATTKEFWGTKDVGIK